MLCRFLSLVVIISFSYSQHHGRMAGNIVDKETHQPLVGANFIIINTGQGTASGQSGSFIINNIPAGSYTVQVSMIEYSERKEGIEINLTEQKIKLGNKIISFEVDAFKKKCLLNGLDDIALSLEKSEKISSYEKNIQKTKPWMN